MRAALGFALFDYIKNLQNVFRIKNIIHTVVVNAF